MVAMWVDLGEACVLDADLLAEQLDLLVEAVILGGKPRGATWCRGVGERMMLCSCRGRKNLSGTAGRGEEGRNPGSLPGLRSHSSAISSSDESRRTRRGRGRGFRLRAGVSLR